MLIIQNSTLSTFTLQGNTDFVFELADKCQLYHRKGNDVEFIRKEEISNDTKFKGKR